MKNYILILIALFALNVNAQYQPTQEQIVNMQKIKELQKTNNQNIEIAKKTTKLTPTKK